MKKCVCIDTDMRLTTGYENHFFDPLFKKFKIYRYKIVRDDPNPYKVKDEYCLVDPEDIWAPFSEKSFNRHFVKL